MNTWLINLALPLIIGPVASYLFELIQRLVGWVGGLSGQTKVVIMGAFSIVLPLVAKIVPGFPSTLDGIDVTAVQSVVTLIMTQIFHKKVVKSGVVG